MQSPLPALSALGAFIGGTAYLSWRFDTSPSFERPVPFTIIVLVLCGTASALGAITTTGDRQTAKNETWLKWRCNQPHPRHLALLAFCILLRTLITGVVTENTQCAVEGLEICFLPAIFALGVELEVCGRLGRPEKEKIVDLPYLAPKRRPRFRYVGLLLIWGLALQATVSKETQSTGMICSGYNLLHITIPSNQFSMIIVDASIIALLLRLKGSIELESSDSDEQKKLAICTIVAFLSAAVITTVVVFAGAIFGLDSMTNLFGWGSAARNSVVSELIVESIIAAQVAVSFLFLLSALHPLSLLATFTASSCLASHAKRTLENQHLVFPPTDGSFQPLPLANALVAVLGFLVLLRSQKPSLNSAGDRLYSESFQRRLTNICIFSAIGYTIWNTESSSPRDFGNALTRARLESKAWINRARNSTTLTEAVSAYRGRYGIPPPPNFDKWYSFALDQNSTIIDEYDQIHTDLFPFWGMAPSVLRDRTTYLVEQVHHGIAGFQIKDGKVTPSPHSPSTHTWMIEGWREMIEPFAKWLPDTHLAFNIDDECRVVPPLEELRQLHEGSRAARSRLAHNEGVLLNRFTHTQYPPWNHRYLAENFPEIHEDNFARFFSCPRLENHGSYSIYDDLIIPTCAADSPARTERWWRRSQVYKLGRGMPLLSSHSWDGGKSKVLLSTLSEEPGDHQLCHRPDAAALNGFLLSPGVLAVARSTILPVFSQGRVPGFADILVPSPWNYAGKVDHTSQQDISWDKKTDGVIWRGASTDGSAHANLGFGYLGVGSDSEGGGQGGTWTGFLRSRFVNLAQREVKNQHGTFGWKSISAPVVNVSFVGNFTKCDQEMCKAQRKEFLPDGNTVDGIDFAEHWKYAHLVDLDGAGFSGRFVPFLKSRSVVYKAALFQTWYDERIHPWRHYVPLDFSLGGIWDIMKSMKLKARDVLGFTEELERLHTEQRLAGAIAGSSISLGELIAEEGRMWAQKVLRKEDMQVYMFRLLLEWGRLVDDRREEIGFV